MCVGPRVYSYRRFSTPEQALGHSGARQDDYAARYAAEHGLVLDEALSLRDDGLSAYHQTHVRRGALGAFLEAVEQGDVPPGSILIVEGLDRLSRAEPLQAQAQLTQIINAGITVVTASDGKAYSRASLRDNPMDLVYSLLVMIRAHEESDTKSKRVRQQIHARIERWLDGRERGIVRQGRDPGWVRELPDRSGFELVPAAAEGVRWMLGKYMAGWGAARIVEGMRDGGIGIGGNTLYAANMYRIIRNPALIGEKRITVDGREYRLPGYYPAVITHGQWHELQERVRERVYTGRRCSVIPIMTGARITHCGYCGKVMVSQTSLNKTRPDGTLPEYARRMMCVDSSQTRNCTVPVSITAAPVERAVLEYCGDAMALQGLLHDDSELTDARVRLATAREALQATQAQIKAMTDQFATMPQVPVSFVERVNRLEHQAQQQAGQVDAMAAGVAALSSGERAELMDQWAALGERAMAGEEAARLHVRELMRQTFDGIRVYVRGFGAAGGELLERVARRLCDYSAIGKEPPIDLALFGRNGRVRLISINRRTGAWRAGAEVDASQVAQLRAPVAAQGADSPAEG